MKVKDKILISGYYGFDNSGDDAILRAIVKDIEENSDNVEITVLSKRPSYTQESYGIKAIDRFNMKETAKAIRDADLFISGGGSLLQDVTSTRSILYYLTLMNYAKKHNIPVMVYANGIGPINKKYNRFLTRRILNKVDLITLRDEDSKSFLKELGVKNKNIYVTCDPVFTMIPSEKSRIEEIFQKEGIPREKPLIGIAIRQWKDAPNLVDTMSESIDKILDEYDVNIVFIPMHYPEDLDISIEVVKNVSKKGIYVLREQYSVEDIMGIIKELELIIAMRLHSLIYATTQGTPMVGLIYDPKIEGFLKFIDVEYMCYVDNMRVEELLQNIRSVWENRSSIREKLEEGDEKFKEKALENVHMALDLLKRR
ncbi:polysaccharide pyruvyl transferase CsaB [Anaerosalibacter sp. Marseille-P3206]|uniref:polysaccharide pyruvyl transferase CsaB n=1 Tax=Anaerosalibacter sp. Marseille-P3206 TaxID=1871005 RepID=UPI000986C260|nr:polysaccharide pyruvyl transferase CsaB [Anaerosalibacter sp. Marseille-P3206]